MRRLVTAAVAAGGLSGWIACDSGSGGDPAAPEASRHARPPVSTPGRGRVAGYVRDVNGHPVHGARVRVAGSRREARTSRGGSYTLRAPNGRRTLVASHPAYATQHVRVTRRPRGGLRLDFSLAATKRGGAGPKDSADALIFWTGCAKVADLSKAQLDRLVKAGVDGFVCSVGRLQSMGGERKFSEDPDAPLRGAPYQLQRRLRASAAVKRARAGALRLYLGFYASDAHNLRTPFKDWFDDRAWSRQLLPSARRLAAAARSLGFVGVALDQELYPTSRDDRAPSWTWDYPGASRSEREVRAQVRHRGSQLMTALLTGFPGLELVAYDTQVPQNWAERVQEVVNGLPGVYARDVRINLWDGLSSVQGYSAIRWLDATFYKSPHLGGGDWSSGLGYNANRIYSLLSRRFSNWEYASSRLHVTPFSWIDEGPSDFSAAREPAYVADQLAAFHRWGTGGMFANYAYGDLVRFNYRRYARAMKRASTPGIVDTQPPELTVLPSVDGGEIEGTASDAFGIRAVRWYDDRDRFGTARLVSTMDDPGGTDTQWLTRWRIAGIPRSPAAKEITIVAEDLKGLASVRRTTIVP